MIISLVIIGLFLISLGCWILIAKINNWDWDYVLPGGVTVLLGLASAIIIIGLIINPIEVKADIVEFEAIRDTFDNARISDEISVMELVAIQRIVAEKNEWLAGAKFWAEHKLTNWFYPKDILALKPIK